MDRNWTDAEVTLARRMAGTDIISVRQFSESDLRTLLTMGSVRMEIVRVKAVNIGGRA